MCSYFQNYVVSILVNNQPIREINKNYKRTCIIPFESEYKLRLKNYHNVRCKVEIFIDGTDVLFGEKLVLNPKQILDLERFLSDNDSGRKFKFVSLEQAQQVGELHDPQNYDNGHIQVKFYKEMEFITINAPVVKHYYNPSPFLTNHTEPFTWTPHIYCSSTTAAISTELNNSSGVTLNSVGSSVSAASCISNPSITTNAAISNSKGVTLEGNISDQKFYEVSDFTTECSPSIIDIWLEGKQYINYKKLSPFIDFIFPAFEQNATDSQIDRAKEWLEKSFITQIDKNLQSVLQIFIIPILTNKNRTIEDKTKAINWLSAFDK